MVRQERWHGSQRHLRVGAERAEIRKRRLRNRYRLPQSCPSLWRGGCAAGNLIERLGVRDQRPHQPSRGGQRVTVVGARQASADEHTGDVASAGLQHSAGTAIIAARCTFRALRAGAGHRLKIKAAAGKNLPESAIGLSTSCALGLAVRTLAGLRSIKSDQAIGDAVYADGVAVDHVDGAAFERRGMSQTDSQQHSRGDRPKRAMQHTRTESGVSGDAHFF
jgi:hypothetical protein